MREALGQRAEQRLKRLTVTPKQYSVIAGVALCALILIVLSGEAVRLTGSGLGCPTWPRCYGHVYPPLRIHAVIEFSNRMISIPVVLASGLAWVAAYRRVPYDRNLARISVLLPLGVIAQAILGGLTVLGKLDYGWVMAHFCLSMIVVLAAAWLFWRSLHAAGERPLNGDRLLVRTARAVFLLTCVVIFAGTAATAAAPDAGGSEGQVINRLKFDGPGTLDFVIHRHAEIAAVLGVLCLFFWWLIRKRSRDPILMHWSTTLCIAMALQGVVGLTQYYTKLPGWLVWIHSALACLVWFAVIWCTFAAGRLKASEEGAGERVEGSEQGARGLSVPAS
jgi:cytochrome c oxidase assembly protein subunit 15